MAAAPCGMAAGVRAGEGTASAARAAPAAPRVVAVGSPPSRLIRRSDRARNMTYSRDPRENHRCGFPREAQSGSKGSSVGSNASVATLTSDTNSCSNGNPAAAEVPDVDLHSLAYILMCHPLSQRPLRILGLRSSLLLDAVVTARNTFSLRRGV